MAMPVYLELWFLYCTKLSKRAEKILEDEEVEKPIWSKWSLVSGAKNELIEDLWGFAVKTQNWVEVLG